METTYTYQHKEASIKPSNQQFMTKLIRKYADLFRSLSKTENAYKTTNLDHENPNFGLASLQQQVNELSHTISVLKDHIAGQQGQKTTGFQRPKKSASPNEIGLKRFRALQTGQ